MLQYAEAQNALLHELASAGLPVPAPLPLTEKQPSQEQGSGDGSGASADGRTLRIRAEDGRLHAVRLLTYLPGTLLVDAPQVGGHKGLLVRLSHWLALMIFRLCAILPCLHQPVHTALLHPLPLQSLELYRQLGAVLGRANRHLADAGWDWTATPVLRRAFDWNVQHLATTYARVRPALLQLPAVDV